MATDDSTPVKRGIDFRFFVEGKWAIIIALSFLLLAVGLTGLRTYKKYSDPSLPFDFTNSGMSDFHNGAYLPSLAFRDRVNPYSLEVCEKYNMARSAPPYSPIVFMIHLPLTCLSLQQADVVYFFINVMLIGLIALMALTMSKSEFRWAPWLWIFGLLMFSRPGHITVFTGYFTAQLVIGTLVALHFSKSRPFISGVGMLLASGKPTYIIPLTILMICRRDFRAVVIGLMFCVIAGVIGVGWLASDSSLSSVVDGVKQGQAAFDDDPNEDPVNSWTRLDIAGVVAKTMGWKPDNKTYLFVMLILLVIPGIAIWKTAPTELNPGATGLTAMITSLALLITIYHNSYDCLLISVAWVGVAFFRHQACPELKPIESRTIAVLLAMTAANYLSTLRFRTLLDLENQSPVWIVITSLNGVCLLLALLILIQAAFRGKRA